MHANFPSKQTNINIDLWVGLGGGGGGSKYSMAFLGRSKTLTFITLFSAAILQMAECRFRPPKTSEEEEKCVFSAIPR